MLLQSLRRSVRTSRRRFSTEHGAVRVWDNVLSPAAWAALTAPNLYNIGPGVYNRAAGAFAPQELVIENLLTAMGMTCTKEVEWWGWSQWKTVEAHRDADEEAAASRGERRFPTHSCLLYLSVEPGMFAPTVFWLPTNDRPSGGGSAKARSALLAVPAVAGRLVLFDGDTLHGVPRPTLDWLGVSAEEHKADALNLDVDRKVLVLNLWDDFAPSDEVFHDDDDDDGDYVDEADVEPADPSPSDAAAVDWQELQKEAPFCDLCCEPRQDWHAVPLGAGPSSHDCIEQPPPSPTHSIGGGDRVVLRTFAHGRDEPLLTPVLASRQAVASVLRSTHAPGWLWTEADVSDLHLGVPSLTGSREERVGA